MSTDPYLSPESSGASAAKAKSMGCLWPALALGGIFLALGFFALMFVSGMSRRGMPAAKRTQCKNNLKQIGLALHNYHDAYNEFPPAYSADNQGIKLHSWRTLILPYMEEQELYNSIDLTKPWNDPANAEAYESRPEIFACPSSNIPDTQTTYMGLVGDDHFFGEDRPCRIRDIAGGTSSTIAVTEVPIAQAVHWMEPTDTAIEFFTSINQDQEVAHEGGVQVLLADGSARFISLSIENEIVEKLISISESAEGEW